MRAAGWWYSRGADSSQGRRGGGGGCVGSRAVGFWGGGTAHLVDPPVEDQRRRIPPDLHIGMDLDESFQHTGRHKRCLLCEVRRRPPRLAAPSTITGTSEICKSL